MHPVALLIRLQNSDVHLPITCRLLGIDKEQMQYWLCNRKIVTANEVLTTPLTISQVAMFSCQLRADSENCDIRCCNIVILFHSVVLDVM